MSGFSGSASGSRFGCPNCGGGLRYDIESRMMKCDRCGGTTDLHKLDAGQEDDGDDTMEVTEFHCPQCGAMVYSTDTSVTGFCSFCGSDVVFSSKLGRTRRPAAIVPFTVTREHCESLYREHLKRYRLKPGFMDSEETVSHFRPVYVPFWSYHVKSEGLAELKGHKSYTKGDYRYDEDYNLSMRAEIDQDHILYDASTAFEDETAAMLQHTAADAVPFHPAYLSGFYAQAADVEADTYQREAAATAVRMFMNQVKAEYAMDRVEMLGDMEDSFGLPNAEYEESLMMMPVWLLAQRQGGRVIYTAVNGSSGQVICDVPVSMGKLGGVILGVAAALFALLYSFLTLKPEMMTGLCAILLLLSQVQFGGAQTVMNLRRTRAYEPDFDHGGNFMGPAQALLKVRDGRIGSRSVDSKKAGETIGKILVFAVIAIVVIATYGGVGVLTKLGSLDSKGGKTLLVVLLFAVLVALIAHVVVKTRQGGSGPMIPRILGCAACAAALFCVSGGVFEDMVYYGCAAAMLLAAIWELAFIIRGHNEYASRPIPFFEKEAA